MTESSVQGKSRVAALKSLFDQVQPSPATPSTVTSRGKLDLKNFTLESPKVKLTDDQKELESLPKIGVKRLAQSFALVSPPVKDKERIEPGKEKPKAELEDKTVSDSKVKNAQVAQAEKRLEDVKPESFKNIAEHVSKFEKNEQAVQSPSKQSSSIGEEMPLVKSIKLNFESKTTKVEAIVEEQKAHSKAEIVSEKNKLEDAQQLSSESLEKPRSENDAKSILVNENSTSKKNDKIDGPVEEIKKEIEIRDPESKLETLASTTFSLESKTAPFLDLNSRVSSLESESLHHEIQEQVIEKVDLKAEDKTVKSLENSAQPEKDVESEHEPGLEKHSSKGLGESKDISKEENENVKNSERKELSHPQMDRPIITTKRRTSSAERQASSSINVAQNRDSRLSSSSKTSEKSLDSNSSFDVTRNSIEITKKTSEDKLLTAKPPSGIKALAQTLQNVSFNIPGSVQPQRTSSRTSESREIEHLNLSRPLIPENRRRGRSTLINKNLASTLNVMDLNTEPVTHESRHAAESIQKNENHSKEEKPNDEPVRITPDALFVIEDGVEIDLAENEIPEWKKKLLEKLEKQKEQGNNNLAEKQQEEKLNIELGKTANKWAKQWIDSMEEMIESNKKVKEEKVKNQSNLVGSINSDDERSQTLNKTIKILQRQSMVTNYIGRDTSSIGAAQLFEQFFVESQENNQSRWELRFINQSFCFGNFVPGSQERIILSENVCKLFTNHPRFTELSSISLAGSGIDDDFMEIFSNYILTHPSCLDKLEIFNLESNLLTEKGIVSLCKILGRIVEDNDLAPLILPNLKEIRLENQKQPLSSHSEHLIEQLMQKNSSITKFGYAFRNLTVQTRMSVHLAKNTDLIRQRRTTDLSPVKNSIIQTDMQRLLKKVADNDESVEKVEIISDPFFLSLKRSEMIDFALSFKKNCFVKHLKLNNLGIDKEFCFALAESLKENNTLAYLDLESNKIPSDAIESLIGSLKFNCALTVLLLNDQSFGPLASQSEGVILEILQENRTLTKLGLIFRNRANQMALEKILGRNADEARKKRSMSAKSLNTSSGVAMEEALSSTRKLVKKSDLELFIERFVSDEMTEEDKKKEILDLVQERSFLTLKDQLKKDFLAKLNSNRTIKVLKLIRLDLNDTHAEILKETLSQNSYLEELNLEGNMLTTKGFQLLIESLKSNSSLRKLYLRNQSNGSILSSGAETVLNEVLDTNTSIIALGVDVKGMNISRKMDSVLAKNRNLGRK